MSTTAAPSVAQAATRPGSRQLRVAFVGEPVWLDGCAPPLAASGLDPCRIELGRGMDWACVTAAARSTRADATVVFDPVRVPAEILGELPGRTLGLHVGPAFGPELASVAGSLDRVASFHPSLTGERAGEATLWRAIPPPVSDAVFAEVRRPHIAMRAMTIGRSSGHRERLLLPAKHHHDLLQIVHGLSGPPLIELLREYDVGVYVAAEPGGAFGPQVGMHLAAGHLLLAEAPTPAHGLERNIDYLHFDSPGALVWILERLQRFPEMHHRIRVRGRLKAEQYRASRLFARIAHDLLADVHAFGSPRQTASS
ncbi:MAG TPA: hypothetical protein VGY30_02575 [Solirubrobacteraceae bacterium]|jgi:hypothetical protein|nr:hypothetical protein [Solirubrobacteraceae bacterium]